MKQLTPISRSARVWSAAIMLLVAIAVFLLLFFQESAPSVPQGVDGIAPVPSPIAEIAATATVEIVAAQVASPLVSRSPLAAVVATPLAEPVPGLTPITSAQVPGSEPVEPVYGYEVLNVYPHDPAAFTQGLIYADGVLFEGTGLRGFSSLRRVDLASGEVLQQVDLAPEFFGEGITLFEDRIIQLTWQSNKGFVYDKESFELLEEFTYPTEGWGITHDGVRLIMSDGTNSLYFWDPETLEEIGRIGVFNSEGPVVRLNELEYIEGEVWANIWQTDMIVRIDPASGAVTGYVDLTDLLPLEDQGDQVDVLNGIAYDADNDRIFVTGKNWPKLFEIQLVPSLIELP